jgi:uncharacterized protein (TIGR02145 family)
MKKIIFSFVFLSVLCSCKKQGCTDPSANNWNPDAKKDNGLCKYSITDVEGNTYQGKSIGNQIWMTENLAVKKYNNGDPIPQVQDPSEWYNLTTGAWCYYENDPNKGILYNWYAVNDVRKLAPAGYRIPNESDWQELIELYNNTDTYSGSEKMRAKIGWENTTMGNGTDQSGFSALPMGYRHGNGPFYHFTQQAYWWSSTISDASVDKAYYFNIDGSDNWINPLGGMSYTMGYSVRCIKD